MRVRFRRPRQATRARLLLATALPLPAAGFFQAAGVNPISLTAAVILTAIALVGVVDALRPVLVVTRRGLVIRKLSGARDVILSWSDIEEVKADSAVVSITAVTAGKKRMMYQLELTTRGAQFVERAYQRNLVSGLGS